MNRKKGIWIGLTVLFMTVIFLFSNQSGDQSINTSAYFVHLLNTVGISEYWVRKLAHMIIFGCLSIVSYHIWESINYTILFCFLYACTDEWHQFFIAERSASPLDVGFDTLGAVVFLAIYLFVKKQTSRN